MKRNEAFDLTQADDVEYVDQWLRAVYGDYDPDYSTAADSDQYSEDTEFDEYQLQDYADSDDCQCDDSDVRIFLLSSEGGYEGGGEAVERVFAIAHKDSDVEEKHNCKFVPGAICFFSIRGYYQSYDGITWDDSIRLIKPKIVETVDFSEEI